MYSKLTENEVKERFIPFLKDFYRQRYEPVHGSEDVQLDNVAEGGVVADGKLSFRKADGTPFVCTYEATSLDKADEVKYMMNVHYFIWDCISFGGIFTTILYYYFYIARLPWLYSLQWAGNSGLLIGLFMIGFFGWYFSMQKWRKYRFIHAIGQFKQYFADEQWIALGEDVFPSPVDPYLLELRDQCVYNGFGLAIVSAEKNVRVLVSPSRLGVFGKDRQLAHWVTRADWYQQVSTVTKLRPPDQITVLWNRMIRPLHYLLVDPVRRIFGKAFGQNMGTYSRFMEAQTIQKWMTALCVLLISPLFFRVVTHRTVDTADLEKLHEWRSKDNPEDDEGYKIDGEAIPYKGIPPGIPKQYPVKANKNEAEDEVQEINLSGNDEDEEITTLPKPKPVQAKPKVKEKITPASKKNTVSSSGSSCAKLQGKKGWIVQDNVFSTAENARARVKALRAKNISCDMVAQSCLVKDGKGYIVWLGNIVSDREKANGEASGFSKKIKAAGLGSGRVLVRGVN